MEIKWYGHSCFLMTDSRGVTVLTDPCDPSFGYDLKKTSADVLTVSHDHEDHNYISVVTGNTQILRTAGEYEIAGIKIKGYDTFHDKSKGALRGRNVMFTYEMDNMRILHCGDLGEIPDKKLLSSLGKIDILLVPIGAIYTIDDFEARELANILKPSVVIPMHYKTPKLKKINLCPVTPFIDAAKDCRIHNVNDCEVTITRQNLGEDRVLILRPYDAEKDE